MSRFACHVTMRSKGASNSAENRDALMALSRVIISAIIFSLLD
ncbi:hypothetical protein [Kosakonia pseudosacchari]|nr:hypothetical protein [Kosakonia pseudosacchari]